MRVFLGFPPGFMWKTRWKKWKTSACPQAVPLLYVNHTPSQDFFQPALFPKKRGVFSTFSLLLFPSANAAHFPLWKNLLQKVFTCALRTIWFLGLTEAGFYDIVFGTGITFASVAQWQSISLVMRRLSVRFRPEAPIISADFVWFQRIFCFFITFLLFFHFDERAASGWSPDGNPDSEGHHCLHPR